MFPLQRRISGLLRGKWQSWLKDGFLLVMPCIMILRLVLMVLDLVAWDIFAYMEVFFLGTGSAIKSSKGGYSRHLRVWTLFEVLPLWQFHDQFMHCQLCFTFPLACPSKACHWSIRGERRRVALRHLAAEFLGVKIQNGEHCPVCPYRSL